MRTCAVIPTYNNIDTIGEIVNKVLQYLPTIVVADGPTDGTLDVLTRIQSNQLTIVSYAKNQGKGYAIKQGFKKARELGYSHVLTIDSDGQHYPEDIPTMLRMSKVRPEAIIIGSRDLAHDNMPSKNTFANKFSNFWFAIQTGLYIPDTQTGFRIYPIERISGESLMTKRYEAELLILVFSAWACVPIVPVPINVYYPPKEKRVSYFKPAKDFTRISILNTILCILAIVYGLPRRFWRFAYYGLLFIGFALWCNICLWWYSIFKPNKIMTELRHKLGVGSKYFLNSFPGARLNVKSESGSLQKLGLTPTIIIANHGSLLDALVMLSLSDKIVLVGKDWVTHNIFYGKIAVAMGIITINDGVENFYPTLEQYIKDGYSIAIFPEGTRTLNGELGRFHRGAFYIAEQLNLPIRPIVLHGFFLALSKSPFYVGMPNELKVIIKQDILPDDTQYGIGYRERTKEFHKRYLDWICDID